MSKSVRLTALDKVVKAINDGSCGTAIAHYSTYSVEVNGATDSNMRAFIAGLNSHGPIRYYAILGKKPLQYFIEYCMDFEAEE